MNAAPAFVLGIGLGVVAAPFVAAAGGLAAAWLHEWNLSR